MDEDLNILNLIYYIPFTNRMSFVSFFQLIIKLINTTIIKKELNEKEMGCLYQY